MITRRSALTLLAAAPFACRAPESRPAEPVATAPKAGRMPVLFVAHGAPMLTEDTAWSGELAAWARALPRPKAILMVSAHWDETPVRVGATTQVPLVYDFSGFPRRFYEVKYPAPVAPALATRVRALLREKGVASEASQRGLDHGAYVPLLCMYPAADVPVLQVSLPGLSPAAAFAMGAALAPLRDEGVLIVGSGFLTHNMSFAFQRGTPTWARDFDAWAAEVLSRHDVDALKDFGQRGPGARIALPTTEHFSPVIVAAGAAPDDAVTYPITGFWMDGAFTRRSVQLG